MVIPRLENLEGFDDKTKISRLIDYVDKLREALTVCQSETNRLASRIKEFEGDEA